MTQSTGSASGDFHRFNVDDLGVLLRTLPKHFLDPVEAELSLSFFVDVEARVVFCVCDVVAECERFVALVAALPSAVDCLVDLTDNVVRA